MTRLLAIAAVALAACGGPRQDVRSDLPGSAGGRLRTFDIDVCYAYVVDPAVQACFVVYHCGDGAAMAAVDCGKLAAGVPETAAVITWATAAPAPVAP
jgi:hypothetical protein